MDGAGLPETRSTCPYCGVGCGVLLRADGNGGLDVRGDPDHPANFGRLCSKGSALGQTVGLEQRLLAPRIDGAEADWDAALDLVANTFKATIAEHGPDSVAFYVSGQLLTEDYYVANKLMKGFIGSANIDTNSRLCMASSVAGHKRAFGTDTVPGTYDDIDEADLVVLVGSNLAWCHPVLFQRLLAARQSRGTKIVVIDPRRTASCADADLHLPLAPGSDVALFNGLLAQIADRGAVDADYASHLNGLDDAIATARADDATITGLDPADLCAFYDLWIGTQRVVTIYSQGVNQSTSGTDKVNAILNCHLATGRIGTTGCGPFSVTGQPNAMGGREVGGLANMLACHLDLENADHRAAVRTFWGATAMPSRQGLKAVDMFRAVADGRIKALWIIHTNPAVSMPDADAVRDAIANCPFTVVSDITAQTDTARLADVLLPATAWAEKDGTVTNSDRTITRQRSVLPAPGRARPDWDILAEVGRRMGFARAFDYANPAEIFREHATLSGIAAGFGRDFDISALSGISDTDYAQFQPARWPVTQERQGGRFFADGAFFHPDGKARLIAVTAKALASVATADAPFVLNTGRLRDQWHTMTRTALSPRLSGHLPEPFVDIHPDDAQTLQIATADLVRLTNVHGQAILRARISKDVQKGQLFAPIHWTGETARCARIDALVAPATDPISGQPESKAGTVAAARFAAAWYGFAVSRSDMALDCDYWAKARMPRGFRAELAGTNVIDDWEAEARRIFSAPTATAACVIDTARGSARIVLRDGNQIIAALYVARTPIAVMRDYLTTLPGTDAVDALTGRVPAAIPNPGPTLCSCFGVGINTIVTAIESEGLMSVDQIGAALGAGTNCGSCRPEIADLLARVRVKEAAE
ncbi:assimilatory nitrate reductase (NADH) alpha subunit apoprotein [Yoonia rosea]|uniref:Assimilatory nitrate reductase (NADH) alpha subunit apoprotein n=1 Tax=Yoonia rosea TaxID=287098 RepID=A0A1R3WA27_9RHOB|nr:nitrate reductase [Yoonia rosea]SIT74134.1 assimilatory nitrate reductase (NADH) alpha subunit apoprotein [Yoonia rosea]